MDTKRWYANTKGIQGLIYDESNGKNIAVSYDVEDALLIAAAPELLEALESILDRAMIDSDDVELALKALPIIRHLARYAIAKATS